MHIDLPFKDTFEKGRQETVHADPTDPDAQGDDHPCFSRRQRFIH